MRETDVGMLGYPIVRLYYLNNFTFGKYVRPLDVGGPKDDVNGLIIKFFTEFHILCLYGLNDVGQFRIGNRTVRVVDVIRVER